MSLDSDAARWAVLIDRGLSGDEQAALEAWIEEDPRRRGALLRSQAAWSLFDRARALPSEMEDEVAGSVPRVGRRRVLQFAGGIAALLVAGAVWHFADHAETYVTGTGEIRRVALADGSLAVVNSGSGVKVRYGDRERDVELSQGEAWFHVAKNKARPFTVSTGSVRVQAVGTAFDVRRRGDMSEVVVTEGKVRIWSIRSDQPPLWLAANQRAVISDRMGVTLAGLTADQASDQLAWREGRIVLDEITLGEAAVEFNRYNRTQLIIAPALASRRIVGSFHLDDLDGFANACSVLTGARVRRADGNITIL